MLLWRVGIALFARQALHCAPRATASETSTQFIVTHVLGQAPEALLLARAAPRLGLATAASLSLSVSARTRRLHPLTKMACAASDDFHLHPRPICLGSKSLETWSNMRERERGEEGKVGAYCPIRVQIRSERGNQERAHNWQENHKKWPRSTSSVCATCHL